MTNRTVPAVVLTLQTRPNDINARNARGQTALHLAAIEGRTDVVAAFLAAPEVDDMVHDSQGRTALQVAKSVEIANILQTSRTQQSANFAELLTAYLSTPTEGPLETPQRAALVQSITRPRARCLDFAVRSKGTTVMHEAARRKDVELLKLCEGRGADVLARDAKGKLPSEVTKDEKVKAFFRASITAEGRKLKASTTTSTAGSGSSAHTSSGSALPPYRSG